VPKLTILKAILKGIPPISIIAYALYFMINPQLSPTLFVIELTSHLTIAAEIIFSATKTLIEYSIATLLAPLLITLIVMSPQIGILKTPLSLEATDKDEDIKPIVDFTYAVAWICWASATSGLILSFFIHENITESLYESAQSGKNIWLCIFIANLSITYLYCALVPNWKTIPLRMRKKTLSN
jgi:hypothetical protein